MKTETHFFDAKRENSVFQTKLELMKSDGEMIRGFTVTFWDRVFECEIPNSEKMVDLGIGQPSESLLDLSLIKKSIENLLKSDMMNNVDILQYSNLPFFQN